MVYAIDDACPSAHGKTSQRPMLLVRISAVLVLYIRNKLFEEKIFVSPMFRVKPYHIVLVALCAYDNHGWYLMTPNQAVGNLLQIAEPSPVGIAAPASVQKIEHRISFAFVHVITGRQVQCIITFCHALQHFARHLEIFYRSLLLTIRDETCEEQK